MSDVDVEPSSHMSVILDLSPTQWHLSSLPSNPYPLSFRTFLSQTLAFLNSHLASKHENTLAVFGALPGKSVLLYSSTESHGPLDDTLADANAYQPFKTVDSSVAKRITEEFDALGQPKDEAPCQLVGALTKALCYINRIMNPGVTTTADTIPAAREPRVIILSVSPDLSTSYIPLMNSIFSAQKLKVTIDVCKIYGPDAVFLQQASHLTGGSYIYLERRDALLQHLIMTFLPPPSVRRILAVPTQDKIDFRAACFCHKTIVDIGFVCSVCLSIFCQPLPVCSTCRTKFPIKTLQRLNASRPSLPSSQPDSRAPSVSGPRTPAPSTPARSRPPSLSNLRISSSSSLPPSNTIQVGVNGGAPGQAGKGNGIVR